MLQTPDPDEDEALLGLWKAYLLARNLAARTIYERCRIVRQIRDQTDTPITDLSTDGIASWLARKVSPGSRSTLFSCLRAWSRWLILTGRRGDDPTAMMGTPKAWPLDPHPIQTVDLATVLTSSALTDRVRSMIHLGAFAGLRAHEIAKVNSNDFDLTSGMFHVTGKGGRRDWLPMHPIVRRDAVIHQGCGYWLRSQGRGDTPIKGGTVSLIISRELRRHGLRDTAHSLRHWFGSELVRQDTDLRKVQQLMRHASLETTARYIQTDFEELGRAVGVLPDIGAGADYQPKAAFSAPAPLRNPWLPSRLDLDLPEDVAVPLFLSPGQLGALPEPDRTIVTLRQVGKTWDQIGQIQGVTAMTALRMHRIAIARARYPG
jgi:integrase/recombinase XerD